jgi:hypothetical protein
MALGADEKLRQRYRNWPDSKHTLGRLSEPGPVHAFNGQRPALDRRWSAPKVRHGVDEFEAARASNFN